MNRNEETQQNGAGGGEQRLRPLQISGVQRTGGWGAHCSRQGHSRKPAMEEGVNLELF